MATSACTFTVAAAISALCHTVLWFSSESVLHEKTLAIIKPYGVYGNYDMIKDSIHESGFRIAREQRIQLDEDTVRSFYAEHSSKSFFASLVKYMTRNISHLTERFKQLSRYNHESWHFFSSRDRLLKMKIWLRISSDPVAKHGLCYGVEELHDEL